MNTLVVLFLSLSAFLLSVEAQTCNATTLCPAEAPCCSEFGYCGTGSLYCLGGCNPFQSNTLESCQPNPVCKSTTYTFKNESRILTNSSLNTGDATQYDWILDGGQVNVTDGELDMLLTETNGGVRLSSTRFVHYGTITATMKTGRWNGVVAAFITMSDIRDEIDWEFPGAATTEGQTNYFWQGTVASHGGFTQGLSDTYDNYHNYSIVWSPQSLVFKVDGKTVRTVHRADTVVNGVSQFPNTPSRIQLSLWPAGTNASRPGTIQWAGGMINWGDSDYTAAGGHFTARVKSIAVKCGDPTPPGPSVQGYVYSGGTHSNPTIAFTDKSTLIGNATASGSANATTSASASSSSSVSSSTSASASSASSSANLTAVSTAGITSASATSSASSSSGSVSGIYAASTATFGNDATGTGNSSSASGASSTSAPGITSTTTLGADAVSSAPASFSHTGQFFGNGGVAESSVSVTMSFSNYASASANASDVSASVSGTPTVTEAASSSSASSTGGTSNVANSNAAPVSARSVEGWRVLAAIFVGMALL